MNDKIIIEILSAGVIASLVTGIFSLVIAIKNNKKVLDIENIKLHLCKYLEHGFRR